MFVYIYVARFEELQWIGLLEVEGWKGVTEWYCGTGANCADDDIFVLVASIAFGQQSGKTKMKKKKTKEPNVQKRIS